MQLQRFFEILETINVAGMHFLPERAPITGRVK
jgi:hypothetical protein